MNTGQVCYSDLFWSQVLSQASFKRWLKAVDVWINIFQVFIFKKKLKKKSFSRQYYLDDLWGEKIYKNFCHTSTNFNIQPWLLGVEHLLHKKCNSAPLDRTLVVPFSKIPSDIKALVAFNEIGRLDFTNACFLISKFVSNYIIFFAFMFNQFSHIKYHVLFKTYF